MDNVGELVRGLRQSKCMSLRALAATVGVSATYVDQIERNERTPSEAVARRLAPVLGFDADELLLQAGRIPSDIAALLRDRPELVAQIRRGSSVVA